MDTFATGDGDIVCDVAQLEGRALEYWCLRVQGLAHETVINMVVMPIFLDSLLVQFKIGVAPTMPKQETWVAIRRMIPDTKIIVAGPNKKPEAVLVVGSTPLEAVMRCLVASIAGPRVSVPPEAQVQIKHESATVPNS